MQQSNAYAVLTQPHINASNVSAVNAQAITQYNCMRAINIRIPTTASNAAKLSRARHKTHLNNEVTFVALRTGTHVALKVLRLGEQRGNRLGSPLALDAQHVFLKHLRWWSKHFALSIAL